MQEEKSTGMPAAVERRKDRSGLEESPTVVRMRNAPQRGGLLTRSAPSQQGLNQSAAIGAGSYTIRTRSVPS